MPRDICCHWCETQAHVNTSPSIYSYWILLVLARWRFLGVLWEVMKWLPQLATGWILVRWIYLNNLHTMRYSRLVRGSLSKSVVVCIYFVHQERQVFDESICLFAGAEAFTQSSGQDTTKLQLEDRWVNVAEDLVIQCRFFRYIFQKIFQFKPS